MKKQEESEKYVERVLLEQFERAIDPKYEDFWFLTPRPLLFLRDEERAKGIIEETRESYRKRLISVFLKIRDEILPKRYRNVLEKQMFCLRNYVVGKVPEAPEGLKLEEGDKEKYGPELWIRENLGFYMKYSGELEGIIKVAEGAREGARVIDSVKTEVLSEEETWKSSRAALRKLIGSQNIGDDKYSISFSKKLCFTGAFADGIESMVLYFRIPDELLRADIAAINKVYEQILKKDGEYSEG